MVKHQKQTIMTRQVGGIHKGFAFEGFLKCLKWSEFAGWTSRKWSRKHSLGVYYNTIWLTTCGLHQFSKKYVCHSYDWLWTPPNTLNLKAFRAVSCIFWWLPSQLSKVKLEAKVLQDPSRPILQALSKQAFGDALPPSTVSKAPENWCTKIQPCVLFCLKRSGTIQSHMKGTNGAAYVHSKQYMNSVCMYVCKYVCTYLCMYECMYECMHACMYILSILGSHVKAPETWLSSIDCKHMQTPSIYPDIAQFKTFFTGISCSLGLPNMQLGWWTEPSLSFSPAFFWCSFHHQLLWF